jgi:hypothetical protein
LRLAIERKSKSWEAKPISKISAIIPWQNFLKATHQQFPLNIYQAEQKSVSDFNVSFSKLKQNIPAESKFNRKPNNQQILFKKAALLQVSDHYQVSQSLLMILMILTPQHASSLFSIVLAVM